MKSYNGYLMLQRPNALSPMQLNDAKKANRSQFMKRPASILHHDLPFVLIRKVAVEINRLPA